MSERTHATRLKEKLLTQIPDLEAHVLIRAANIDRKEIIQKQYKFTGFLTEQHYDENLASLTALV